LTYFQHKHSDSQQILRLDATARAANIQTGNMQFFQNKNKTESSVREKIDAD
jgi:hypothetical protein